MVKLNIALDGPAGAGKSTVAKMIAQALGYVYVDTGAMYRAVTWKVIQSRLQPSQTEEIIKLIGQLQMTLIPGEFGQQVIVNEEDVTEHLRTTEVNHIVAHIAQIPEVREWLVQMQRQFAVHKGVVMDGRDIATHVMPDADLKIFLTATVQARAYRRWKEMRHLEQSPTLEQIEQDIASRDQRDEQRETAPLVKAADAIVIDTTNYSQEQIVEQVLQLCESLGAGRES